MRYLFHGASVTKQAGQESYFYWLERMLHSLDGSHVLIKSAYGACHFNDAGFLTIFEDLKKSKPNVCLFDWNTTGLSEFDMDKVVYATNCVLSAGAVPIFLILASHENLNSSRPAENKLIEFCLAHNLVYIDCRCLVVPSVHFRDTVHTNKSGAILYAEVIFDLIKNITLDSMPSMQSIFISKEYFIDSKADYNLDVYEGLRLAIEVSEIESGAQLIAAVIHGPSSPYVDIAGASICLWDRWSHYERIGYSTFWSSDVISDVEEVSVFISSKKIDYSICNRDFEYFGKKILKIRGLFAVNCQIKRISVSSLGS